MNVAVNWLIYHVGGEEGCLRVKVASEKHHM